MKEKLVVVGNGMAGIRAVEELLKLAPEKYAITVFGAEDGDRVLFRRELEQLLDRADARHAVTDDDQLLFHACLSMTCGWASLCLEQTLCHTRKP